MVGEFDVAAGVELLNLKGFGVEKLIVNSDESGCIFVRKSKTVACFLESVA